MFNAFDPDRSTYLRFAKQSLAFIPKNFGNVVENYVEHCLFIKQADLFIELAVWFIQKKI